MHFVESFACLHRSPDFTMTHVLILLTFLAFVLIEQSSQQIEKAAPDGKNAFTRMSLDTCKHLMRSINSSS